MDTTAHTGYATTDTTHRAGRTTDHSSARGCLCVCWGLSCSTMFPALHRVTSCIMLCRVVTVLPATLCCTVLWTVLYVSVVRVVL